MLGRQCQIITRPRRVFGQLKNIVCRVKIHHAAHTDIIVLLRGVSDTEARKLVLLVLRALI